jgi:hypothetical protein
VTTYLIAYIIVVLHETGRRVQGFEANLFIPRQNAKLGVAQVLSNAMYVCKKMGEI